MNVAMYIEDGYHQIVLTPETKYEENILMGLKDAGAKNLISIESGSFYHCQGGWVRQGMEKTSTILVIKRNDEKEQPK